MSLFAIGFVQKIIGSLFFLISGLLWKKLLTKKLNYHVIFYRTLSSLFFILLLIIIYHFYGIESYSVKVLYEASLWDWTFTIGLCAFSYWGLYFYTTAIQNGRYSFVTPLSGVTVLFSFFTSVFIYNESLTLLKCTALLFIIGGLLYHQKDKFINIQISKEVLFILLSSIFWGISFVLYLIPIKKFGVLNFSFILEFCVFMSTVLLLITKDKKIIPPTFDLSNLSLCILMGMMVAGGSVLSNFSLTELPVSINIMIGLLFEIFILLIGIFKFKEQLSQKDWILILLVSFGSFTLMI